MSEDILNLQNQDRIMEKIEEAQKGTFDSHLYPFFWQHGESEEQLLKELDAIQSQSIRNFCIESRPHPEFLKAGWWKTMDFLLNQAKTRGMNVWILDDSRFPTGFANGSVPDHLKKRYLKMSRFDLCLQSRYATLDLSILEDFRSAMKNPKHADDRLFRVCLADNITEDRDSFEESSLIDVTLQVTDDRLELEGKPGQNLSVFVIYETSVGDEAETQDYLDPMNPEAVDCLLSEVYEKHYEHYKDEFGKTIQGFFSDEPRFGNTKGPDAIIGKKPMPLPWNDLVRERLSDQGFDWKNLPLLFAGSSSQAGLVRDQYMDTITGLYQKNFSNRIGNWCRDHGVMWIGHVIEDNNAHQRLGYGPGHYFRAVDGQDLAGVDIIGGQIVPGMPFHHTAFSTGGSDGEFYHYALCRLGASSAMLDPRKKGRLMCEAYGAYGWVEGLKMMKWITDLMISQGVNYIVPHAFNPKAFPDWDCPPHFYANGKNPQYPYFHKLMEYADRLCHLFSDGKPAVRTGVLYTAHAEWSKDTMQLQKVMKVLEENQIPAAIISEDWLSEGHAETEQDPKTQTERPVWNLNGIQFEKIIIPEAQLLPPAVLQELELLPIEKIFIRRVPDTALPASETVQFSNYQIAEPEKLPELLSDQREIGCEKSEPMLRAYCMEHTDGCIWMFSNADTAKNISTRISLKTDQPVAVYDAMENRIFDPKAEYNPEKQEAVFSLKLEPYESVVLFNGLSRIRKPETESKIEPQISPYQIRLEPSDQSETILLESEKELPLLHRDFPGFSGTVRYDFEAVLPQPDVEMVLPEAYESIEVTVNGKSAGVKIFPPYRFCLSDFAEKGTNHIQIAAAGTPVRSVRDGFSQFIAMEPIGLCQPPEFFLLRSAESE